MKPIPGEKIQCSKCKHIFLVEGQTNKCPECGRVHIFIKPANVVYKIKTKKPINIGAL